MGNFTYYPTKLATSQKDQVRWLVGDVVAADPQLQDEEINWILTQRSSVWGAAAECCMALAAKFGRSVDQAVGTAKTSFSQMAKAYTAKALIFNARAASMGSGLPYAGALSLFDMMAQIANDDRPAPQFTIGMMDSFYPVAPAGGESDLSSSGGGT
jgi:hypothetical protein